MMNKDRKNKYEIDFFQTGTHLKNKGYNFYAQLYDYNTRDNYFIVRIKMLG